MTQMALAHALGITFEQLHQYEKGRNRLGARRLQDIAAILRVPAAALSGPDREAGRAATLRLGDSADALRLIRAYAALPTPRMKRALVSLAERMAGVGR